MAKRKPKSDPIAPADPMPRAPRRCFRCDGTGELCSHCGETEAICECDEDDQEGRLSYSPYDCPDCTGTGE